MPNLHAHGNKRPCRFCATLLHRTFVDLGMSPISNAFRRPEDKDKAEVFYPLHTYVCESCKLVQLPRILEAEKLFTADYAYFSSFAQSWLEHAKRFVDQAVTRFKLGANDLAVEIASNDGYLLQYFARHNVAALGIDPAVNVAQAAQERGVPTLVRFFGRETAEELVSQGRKPRIMIANNVLAHVPDINDFIAGFKILLAPDGVISFEFPHLLKLIEGSQFDTIYHEHYSYLSYLAVARILAAHELRAFDVEHLPTHGGSLRLFVCHKDAPMKTEALIEALIEMEQEAGLDALKTYDAFGENVRRVKRGLLKFVVGLKEQGKRIVAYGAPAKGNTLLNYCGIRTDIIDFAVDRSPRKQGTLLPGTGIPVYEPERITQTKPDCVLILPWNLKDEIAAILKDELAYNGQIVVPIPDVTVLQ